MRKEPALLKRWALHALGLAGIGAGLAVAAAIPATAQRQRTQIVPYLEVDQVLSADLNGGDVLTYTSLAAGIDARTKSRRVEAQISYRYERRIGWDDNLADDDVHTGLAAMRAELVPNVLTFNAGALATRSGINGSGPVFGFSGAGSENLTDVYSLYAGPDFSSKVGPLDVTASYRFGYVKVDDHRFDGLPLPTGSARFDGYNSSINHSASASFGMGPGLLPFGWTVGTGYVREETGRLDQEYEGKFIRGDVILPVTPTLAVTGGVGYEKAGSTQRDIVRGADSLPILTPGGNLIADPSKPRLLAYDQSGLIWDAGVIWRPGRRTEVQARIGRRYGDTTFTGSFKHQLNSAYAISGSIYDSVDSFGRVVVAGVASLPVNFKSSRNPLNRSVGGIGGCVFGNDPGTGACLDNAFQAISNSNFRNRGATILFSGGRGPWSMGVGAGYSQRQHFEPLVNQGFALNRLRDENFTLSGNIARALSRTSGVAFDAYANWSDSGLPGSQASFGTGVTGSYHRSLFYDRLQAQAALGAYTSDTGFSEDGTVLQALIGLRYSF
jgi:uncharacterized protein (PEP-CTERM system associated)